MANWTPHRDHMGLCWRADDEKGYIQHIGPYYLLYAVGEEQRRSHHKTLQEAQDAYT